MPWCFAACNPMMRPACIPPRIMAMMEAVRRHLDFDHFFFCFDVDLLVYRLVFFLLVPMV